jgi:hypothetical protein
MLPPRPVRSGKQLMAAHIGGNPELELSVVLTFEGIIRWSTTEAATWTNDIVLTSTGWL